MGLPRWDLRVGHVMDRLREVPDESVHCVVTSPPYFGLRSYGLEPSPWPQVEYAPMAGLPALTVPAADACLGLESTPEEYVGHLVAVFREVRRVLRRDGTIFLNIGDSYGGQRTTGRNDTNRETPGGRGGSFRDATRTHVGRFKPKDLVGIPWRVAFALQADGWWLRSDIVWKKGNPMPESVRDRPTRAHEYVFLLAKWKRYFYDADAVAEPAKYVGDTRHLRTDRTAAARMSPGGRRLATGKPQAATRNRRSVWTINTRPFKAAHFAVFPPGLPEVCINAGTSERGCCPECGAPWERVVERETCRTDVAPTTERGVARANGTAPYRPNSRETGGVAASVVAFTTTGWRPTCDHDAEPVPCTVLDPFAGAGTTGLVALRLQRSALMIEASEEYADLIRGRMEDDAPPLFSPDC